MNDYKSVQDLIVKAALYDGVSTTIAPPMENIPAVKITFSKGDRRSTTLVDMNNRFGHYEIVALYACKEALHKLMWGPYEEIECKKR